VSRYSWRSIFYINLPIGIVLIVLIAVLLGGSEVRSRLHIDVGGASLFFGTILFLMLGLNLLAESLSLSSLVLTFAFLAVSFSLFFLFFRQEKRDPNPILDMTFLKTKPFLAANLFNMITGAGMQGICAFIPLYATSVFGLSTLASGMVLTPRSLAMIPASVVTSFMLWRTGYRKPMVLGLVIMSFSVLLLGQDPGLWRAIGISFGIAESIALILLFLGVGCGTAFPASNNACIELMPEKAATITGVRGMFVYVGGALGISFTTIVLHLSSTPALGFRIAFISFGLGLLFTIPSVFLLPIGKKKEIRSSG